MRSETAVRRRAEATASERTPPTSVSAGQSQFVGLAGLEPAASSLSEIDGRAPCYPASSQAVLIRKSLKDGVNCGA